MQKYLLTFLFAFSSLFLPSFAQNAPPQDPVHEVPSPFSDPAYKTAETDDFQGKFMNMLFLLAMLVGFMLLASWMLKRMTRTRAASLNQGSEIKILETRTLSPRSTLYLIELNGKNLLVAESQMGVSLLSTKETPVEEYTRAPRTVS